MDANRLRWIILDGEDTLRTWSDDFRFEVDFYDGRWCLTIVDSNETNQDRAYSFRYCVSQSEAMRLAQQIVIDCREAENQYLYEE